MRRAILVLALLLSGCCTGRHGPPTSGLAVGWGPEDVVRLPGGRLVVSCGCLKGANAARASTRGLYSLSLPPHAGGSVTTNWVALRGHATHGLAVFPGETSVLVSAKSGGGSQIWQVDVQTGRSSLWATSALPVNDLVISADGDVYAVTSLTSVWQSLFHRSVAKVLQLRPCGPHREICGDVEFGAGIACWRDSLLVSSSLDGEVWIVDPADGRHHAVAAALGCTDNISSDPRDPDVFYVAALRHGAGLLFCPLNRAEVWQLHLRADTGSQVQADVRRLRDLPFPALVSCALPDGQGGLFFGRNIGDRVDHLCDPVFVADDHSAHGCGSD